MTGASGFIGGCVMREFVDRGWYVHALVHHTVSEDLTRLGKTGKVVMHHGDMTDFHTLQRIFTKCDPFDAVVHCGGRASDIGRAADFRQANLVSVRHLARLTMDMGARRFVFVSSTDVYGMRDFDGEDEDALPFETFPVNPYPKFKILAEKWVGENIPKDQYAIVRPAAVWGLGDTTLTKRVVDYLRVFPAFVYLGKWRGKNRWPLAHVKNVAAAIFLLASKEDCAGEVINVLDSEWTSVDDFYRMVAKAFFPDKHFRSVTIPLAIASPVAWMVTVISNLLRLSHPFMDPSHYALLTVSSNLDFDNRRFLDLMESGGRKPVTLREGLAELNEADR